MRTSALLREARRRAGLSQRDLAARAGIAQPAVARIESGAVVPRVDTLDRLLAACGLEVSTSPRLGAGLDRTQIHAMLALMPTERLALATDEGRNLDAFLEAAHPR